ncbi:MAG TPA: ABC transporter ATP-binding protein [Solirubrobacteraceae bacterium]|nr:ABC transporter ATP-binding protein [Solirubrobacteraceae bacterium]
MTPRSLSAVAPSGSTDELFGSAVPLDGYESDTADARPLSLRGVSKRWSKDQSPVLDRLTLTLEPATKTWVGGRNGAGKTTMLRIAAGLIEPDGGDVKIWGVSARHNPTRHRRLVSLLPAGDRGLYARLTVRRQLEFWARIAMVPRERFRRSIEEAIDCFELSELAGRRVDRMSMGQRQRLRIAMTFLPEPEVVLLDEPLTSLDAEGTALLNAAIDRLLARDGAVLWCSPSGEHLDMRFHTRWILERGGLVSA